jgi:hypothetical protein
MRMGLASIAAAALALAPPGGGALSASPPPNGGTISIEPKTADGKTDPSMASFVDAAAEALTARGFTVFDDPDHAASVVELLLSRSDVGTSLARVPGQRAASVVGTGVSVPLSTGASELVPLRRTRLELRIRRRGEAAVVWDGTAVTVREAGTREGTDRAVASDLSQALLQAYPTVPKDVVGVP